MVHLGNNIAKLRGFRRIPQKEMASKLKISQQDYSKLEQKEQIDDDLLQLIADALDFPVEVIKHLDSNTSALSVNQQGGNTGSIFYQYPPDSEGVVQLYEKLLQEKENLLKAKDEIIQQKDELIQMYKQKAS